MSTVPLIPASLLSLVAIGRELDKHPSAPLRWINRGTVLASGERVKLVAVRTPGGWRVRREDLDAFLATLTADRLQPEETPARTSAPNAARIAKMNDELARAGF
jgi:hypothetical protein